MEDEEARKQHAYEEFVRGKLMIDEIVHRVQEEDASVALAKFEQKLP